MGGDCMFAELCLAMILRLCTLLYGVYITLNYMTGERAENVLAKSYKIDARYGEPRVTHMSLTRVQGSVTEVTLAH